MKYIALFLFLSFLCNADEFMDISNNYERSFSQLMRAIYNGEKDLGGKISEYRECYIQYRKTLGQRNDYQRVREFEFSDISARKLKITTFSQKKVLIIFGLNRLKVIDLSTESADNEKTFDISSVVDCEFFDIDEDGSDDLIVVTESLIKIYSLKNNIPELFYKYDNVWNLQAISKITAADGDISIVGVKKKQNLFDIFWYVSEFHWLFPGFREKIELGNITSEGNTYGNIANQPGIVVYDLAMRGEGKIACFLKERSDLQKIFEKNLEGCSGIVSIDVFKELDDFIITVGTFSGIEEWRRDPSGEIRKTRKLFRIPGLLSMSGYHRGEPEFYVLCSSGKIFILHEKNWND